MALAVERDSEAVVDGFVRWLREQDPANPPELVGYERAAVGFSSETFLVDIRRAGSDGPRDERLVLKLPPPGPGGFPDYDFHLQARTQEAAAAAGVPAPAPVQVEDDPQWMGTRFLVMPAVAGHIIDASPTRDHWLTKEDPALSTTVFHNYIDVIADIHAIDWRAVGLADVVPHRDNSAEIAYWRRYLDWYADGQVLVPTLLESLDWCEEHRPASEPEPALLWGDVRLGNVIFGEDRAPVAVLDWEMATIGAPEHDLAWTLTLEATHDELFRRRVVGFPEQPEVVARYEARLGRPVQDLEWYEIFAMVRSTAIMTRLAYLHDRAGMPALWPIADNPILGILQRRIAAADGA